VIVDANRAYELKTELVCTLNVAAHMLAVAAAELDIDRVEKQADFILSYLVIVEKRVDKSAALIKEAIGKLARELRGEGDDG
jgi:hypothetical protein